MKTKTLNYQQPEIVEVYTDCYGVLCVSDAGNPGSSIENLGDLEDFFGKGLEGSKEKLL